MTSDNKLVSVIIPCYNHEQYVEECILSVVNQTYSPVQLIVIDDGSVDNSFAIIQRLGRQYNFIAKKQKNAGLSKTLNTAIKEYANGELICLVASDDKWELDKIEKQVKFIHTNPKYGLVCGRSRYMDENGKIGGEVLYNLGERYNDYTFDNIFRDNQISALTVMFKKEVWASVGFFDESSYIEDWDLWLKISDKYEVGFQDEFLGYWREHSTNSSSRLLKMVDAKLNICEKWKDKHLYKTVKNALTLDRMSILAKEKKLTAIKEMITNIRFITKKRYWKIAAKLLIIW